MPPAAPKAPAVTMSSALQKCSAGPSCPKCSEKSKSPEKPECERNFQLGHARITSQINNQSQVSYEARKNWVKQYVDKERLGTAILQRQHRLIAQQKAKSHSEYDKLSEYTIVSSYAEPKSDPDPESRSESGPESDLDQELTELREEYWEHQIRLNELFETRPINVGTVEEVLLFRNHRDRYNRPFVWVLERERCAARGGCCGRACGCCERPLDQYLQPAKDGEQDGRKVVQLMGHCTVECACCIQVRGCYIPHEGLPSEDDDGWQTVIG